MRRRALVLFAAIILSAFCVSVLWPSLLEPEVTPMPTAHVVTGPAASSAGSPVPTAPAAPSLLGVTHKTFVDAVMQPFVDEAGRRRAERALADPDYFKRVNKTLNEGRVNFALFGYGETYEPPAAVGTIIGSHTIVSYDTRTGRADLISLTHDIRAPEVERYLQERGETPGAAKIDQAYNVGGYNLMRDVLEDSTGLAIDFQIVFRDAVLQKLVDEELGPIQVDVPADFDVRPFIQDGVQYPASHFAKGKQTLTGAQVLQFIKAIEGTYARSLERNQRKYLVFRAILDGFNQNCTDYGWWLGLGTFTVQQVRSEAIQYDFDTGRIVLGEIGSGLANLGGLFSEETTCGFAISRIGQTKYVVDPAQGDGGVQWVTANAAVNPITKKDLLAGVYPHAGEGFEVPFDANPYGDLVTAYWPSVRYLVARSLSGDGR